MKTKTFDCVEMKREIQQKILRENDGLTPPQQRERRLKRIEADPILGPVWRQAMNDAKSASDPTVQESR